ncbi:hypothetical protein L2E82_39169 [Cichorium intybus]|uniref:Uncharacterized protein n=1 Tax=Cichorium intybus TaxID=13427 RepID=A0ACB9AHR0_CICIN|nr:hypothetical protein L2E82_39169 [Cichorium intybus]
MGSTYGSGFVSSVEDGRVRTWLDGFYVNCALNTCTMCIYINDVLWVYFLVYVINCPKKLLPRLPPESCLWPSLY